MRHSFPHMMTMLLALCAWQFCSAYEVRVLSSSCEDGKTYTVDDGAKVTLLATADEGSQFTKWEDGSTTNPRTLTVISDTTLTATFEKSSGSSPDKKTITVYGAGCQTPFTADFLPGTKLSLLAYPREGYKFKCWSDKDTSNPRSVTVTDDATYTAEFERYSSSAVAMKEIITGTNTCDTIDLYYLPPGTELILEAQITDQECGAFEQWEDKSTKAKRVITVSDDAAYTAKFGKIKYTIITQSDDDSQGSAEIIKE